MGRRRRTIESVLSDCTHDASGCWLWSLAKKENGYGQVMFGGINCYVHRLVYEYLVGPIPDGLVIDHLCRVRHCANPDHMEVVTHAENVRRGDRPGHKYGTNTHCGRGHAYTPENTAMYNGYRRCRICAREAYKKCQRKKLDFAISKIAY